MLPNTRYQKVTNGAIGEDLESNRSGPLAQWIFSYRTAFYIVLVVYIITAVASYTYDDVLNWKHTQSDVVLAVGIPNVPFDRAVLFDADASYAAYMNGIDDPWTKNLLPPGRGFINVPTEITQPDGSTKVEDKQFCVSMFHQLHCIAGLKWIFESADNTAVNKSSEAYIMKKEHMAHCFDFLRQAVMCAGDMTLEPVDDEATDGWNVTHTCRDFKTIYDFAAERRVTNITGIL
ncbi:hypothetical protein ONS95_003036 [Cadophora gregata]|uniref:uncharacterized protein n=1 Tax=Cadophora gregata TaxID=51156 RepID=UPI0026DCEAB5|nr:uncharacterized protein ONS95_003036 [Cadophora gregata]KAK0108216.1 hypothetical protein ONS95_003036 [Cadophora gregata]KAK0109195.1 hypothetical protein ONS96_003018 [Cadophora gregata f. sp. sojae]